MESAPFFLSLFQVAEVIRFHQGLLLCGILLVGSIVQIGRPFGRSSLHAALPGGRSPRPLFSAGGFFLGRPLLSAPLFAAAAAGLASLGLRRRPLLSTALFLLRRAAPSGGAFPAAALAALPTGFLSARSRSVASPVRLGSTDFSSVRSRVEKVSFSSLPGSKDTWLREGTTRRAGRLYLRVRISLLSKGVLLSSCCSVRGGSKSRE